MNRFIQNVLFVLILFIHSNCSKPESNIDRLLDYEIDSDDLQFYFEDGSYINRNKLEKKILLFNNKKNQLTLSNNSNLKALLVGSLQNNNHCSKKYCLEWKNNLNIFIAMNLKNYYSYFKNLNPRGGNYNASNEFATGQFNYNLINQLQSEKYAIDAVNIWSKNKNFKQDDLPIEAKKYWENENVRGMECQGASIFHQFKSLGLVRPDLNREQIEEQYTELHPNIISENPRIPKKFNNTLRFRNSTFQLKDISEMISILKESEWAKLTGSNQLNFKIIEIDGKSSKEKIRPIIKNVLDNGWIINVHENSYSHSVCLKHLEKKSATIDDSYAMQVKLVNKFDLKNYYRFWYIVAER